MVANLPEHSAFLVVSSITSVILEDLLAPLRHGYDLGIQRSIRARFAPMYPSLAIQRGYSMTKAALAGLVLGLRRHKKTPRLLG